MKCSLLYPMPFADGDHYPHQRRLRMGVGLNIYARNLGIFSPGLLLEAGSC